MLGVLLLVLGLTVMASRRIGLGAASGPLELVGRLPLDARRAIYLVRVGPQVLVVGASDGGLVKLSELALSDLGSSLEKAPQESLAKAFFSRFGVNRSSSTEQVKS